MAGIFKRVSDYFLGSGEDQAFEKFIEKIDNYSCPATRLYCREPTTATLLSIYTSARLTLKYNESNQKFYFSLQNLGEKEDSDEEDEILLPLVSKVDWNLDEPETDDEIFKIRHYFNYTKLKNLKHVGGSAYVIDFTEDSKTTEYEAFEDLVNEILDVVEKQETEQNDVEEEKKEETKDVESKGGDEDTLFEGSGTFFVFNKDEEHNEVIEENCHFLVEKLEDDYSYAFTVLTSSREKIMLTKLHKESQVSIQSKAGVIMWIHDTCISSDEELNAYLFYFTEDASSRIEDLSSTVSKCIFECQRQVTYEEYVKEDDMDWMADAYVEDAREDDQSEYNDEDDYYEGIDEEGDILMDEEQVFENRDMIQAHGYDREFVARGDGMGVYGADEENNIKFFGDIPLLKEYTGAPVENMMLYENENKLLFMDPLERNKINCFDFEKEKVVEEWGATGNKDFTSFFSETKNAQDTPSTNIVATTEKGMFNLDPRLNKSDKTATKKIYSTNYLFNKIATNLNGNIAVGSKNGEIRMYTKMGQNAKTMLPGLGDKFTHIDVSKDGTWILATTNKYILLIPTRMRDGKNGFEKRMGKEKPIPRKLKLVNSDQVKFGLTTSTFTKASFNNGGNTTESFITASIGNYIVIWKLKKVAKGNLGDYDIKKLHNSVVASEGKWNTENEIIVALPKSLTLENRRRKA